MFLKGVLNPRPVWWSLVWPKSNEKCQALCKLSYRGTCRIMLQTKKNFNFHVNFTKKSSKIPFLTNFRTFPHKETYAKLILLKKAIFHHKMIFLQQLETTSPIVLLGCSFVNLGKKKFKSCKILLHFYLVFLKSIHFCLFILQNSWKFFSFSQNLKFFKISQWNSIFSCKFKLSPLFMNEEKWKKCWVVYVCYRIIFEQCALIRHKYIV